MNKKSNTQFVAFTCKHKGYTLRLAQGAQAPVVLVINHNETTRPDGVVEVVASPQLAKAAVNRRVKAKSKANQRKEIEAASPNDLAAALAFNQAQALTK